MSAPGSADAGDAGRRLSRRQRKRSIGDEYICTPVAPREKSGSSRDLPAATSSRSQRARTETASDARCATGTSSAAVTPRAQTRSAQSHPHSRPGSSTRRSRPRGRRRKGSAGDIEDNLVDVEERVAPPVDNDAAMRAPWPTAGAHAAQSTGGGAASARELRDSRDSRLLLPRTLQQLVPNAWHAHVDASLRLYTHADNGAGGEIHIDIDLEKYVEFLQAATSGDSQGAADTAIAAASAAATAAAANQGSSNKNSNEDPLAAASPDTSNGRRLLIAPSTTGVHDARPENEGEKGSGDPSAGRQRKRIRRKDKRVQTLEPIAFAELFSSDDDRKLVEAVMSGARFVWIANNVKFSQRFQADELLARWMSLLRDPVESARTAVRAHVAERCSTRRRNLLLAARVASRTPPSEDGPSSLNHADEGGSSSTSKCTSRGENDSSRASPSSGTRAGDGQDEDALQDREGGRPESGVSPNFASDDQNRDCQDVIRPSSPVSGECADGSHGAAPADSSRRDESLMTTSSCTSPSGSSEEMQKQALRAEKLSSLLSVIACGQSGRPTFDAVRLAAAQANELNVDSALLREQPASLCDLSIGNAPLFADVNEAVDALAPWLVQQDLAFPGAGRSLIDVAHRRQLRKQRLREHVEICRLENDTRDAREFACGSFPYLALLRGPGISQAMVAEHIVLGRPSSSRTVDIDISAASNEPKSISRLAAVIRFFPDGDFLLKNAGRSGVAVDGVQVDRGKVIHVLDRSLVQINDASFVFEVNRRLVADVSRRVRAQYTSR